jgi:hypothetical protein
MSANGQKQTDALQKESRRSGFLMLSDCKQLRCFSSHPTEQTDGRRKQPLTPDFLDTC